MIITINTIINDNKKINIIFKNRIKNKEVKE